MNFSPMHLKVIKRSFLALIVGISILSCGSGAIISAGISGTGIVFGTITGFGSIIVNGVKYDIDEASFDIDGSSFSGREGQSNLEIGMVVRLKASDNGDGTGVATHVVYDDLIEGPVSEVIIDYLGDSNLKLLTVLGQRIIINASSTAYKNVNFTDISANDVIEVSGFVDQNGDIIATHVELKAPGGEVELHGQVSNLVENISFDINGVTIFYDEFVQLEDLASGLQNEVYVEVHGILQGDSSVEAVEIEGEDDDRDEISNASGDLSLHGIITTFSSSNEFEVDGIPVDASSISFSITDGLFVGLQVEVQGEMSDGVLIANQLEVRSGESHFNALIKSVYTNSIGIGFPDVDGEIVVLFDSQSQLEDEQGLINPLTLLQLTPGMEVRVEAKTSGSDLVVTSLKRAEPLEEYEIEGVSTAKSIAMDDTLTLTIHGLDFVMDNVSAGYEINEVEESKVDFFNALVEGSTRVELVDTDKDGDFDEAEID